MPMKMKASYLTMIVSELKPIRTKERSHNLLQRGVKLGMGHGKLSPLGISCQLLNSDT